jgi:hypothetical protein
MSSNNGLNGFGGSNLGTILASKLSGSNPSSFHQSINLKDGQDIMHQSMNSFQSASAKNSGNPGNNIQTVLHTNRSH